MYFVLSEQFSYLSMKYFQEQHISFSWNQVEYKDMVKSAGQKVISAISVFFGKIAPTLKNQIVLIENFENILNFALICFNCAQVILLLFKCRNASCEQLTNNHRLKQSIVVGFRYRNHYSVRDFCFRFLKPLDFIIALI